MIVRSSDKWSCKTIVLISILFFILFSLCYLYETESNLFAYSKNDTAFNSNETNLNNTEIELKVFRNASEANTLDILESIHFKDAVPVSVVSDSEADTIYVVVNPNKVTSQSCSNDLPLSKSNITSMLPCSAIYIIDSLSLKLINIIRLSPGEQIRDIDLDSAEGTIYAVGEYNYVLQSNETEEEELYEDDVLYIISNVSKANVVGDATSISTANNSTSIFAPKVTRLSMYGETEEGKEGDARTVVVDIATNTIYAGLVYFEGGKEGLYVIPKDVDPENFEIIERAGLDLNFEEGSNINDTGSTSKIFYIPFNGSGPDKIVVDDGGDRLYASDKDGDFVAVINGSYVDPGFIERIILQSPRALSIYPENNSLYIASGDRYWFNVIDTKTNKIISSNEQMISPLSSIVNVLSGEVYVVNCNYCEGEIGSEIYQLNRDGSTKNSKGYETIRIEGVDLALNPITQRLYVIGTNVDSESKDLYVINIASPPIR
jgi:DNA-binding beta-propeller fold protein YncE